MALLGGLNKYIIVLGLAQWYMELMHTQSPRYEYLPMILLNNNAWLITTLTITEIKWFHFNKNVQHRCKMRSITLRIVFRNLPLYKISSIINCLTRILPVLAPLMSWFDFSLLILSLLNVTNAYQTLQSLQCVGLKLVNPKLVQI